MTTCAHAIRAGLEELLLEDQSVVLLGEDLRDPYGGAFKITKGLTQKFDSQIINTPISEAGITGVTIGLAIGGFRPILEIMFGDFITLCCDQIVNHASKFSWMFNGKISVPMVIRTPMGGYRGYGPTHSQTLEKLFLGIPGIEVIAPSLYHHPGKLLKEATKLNAPVLFVENKTDYPEKLRPKGESFGEGLNQTIKLKVSDAAAADVTVVCYGGMARRVADAAEQLFLEEEINAELVIPSNITDVPQKVMMQSLKETGRLVVIEEGSLSFGWGAEVSASVTENALDLLKRPPRRIGAKNTPIGSSQRLEGQSLPQPDDIRRAILEVY